ncbi:MAG: carboxypeptidase M32 [Spirochaetia bacterium]|nr:carboxypeptidase M32 [Spirochaetia bacterium]
MDYRSAIKELEEIDRQIVLLEHISSTLSYDQEQSLSLSGVEERSRQLGYLAEQKHELVCSVRMEEILGFLEGQTEEDEFEKALIRLRRREFDKSRNLDPDLIRAISEQACKAHVSWVASREQDDWSLFSQDLSTIVALVKQKASMLAHAQESLYDVLLDDYEPTVTSKTVDSLFQAIKPKLLDLIDVLQEKQIEDSFLFDTYSVDKQDAFAKRVLSDMGFDFNRGSFAVSVHPFTSTVGCDDVRITTRYSDPSVADSFSSSIHEGGHALYELGASSGRLKGTSLASGASFGMHESQSRFWENMIGRSLEFWEFYYPYFCDLFPKQTASVDVLQFVKALNKVKITPIRVNADEISYNLHIMLRFEVEKLIIDDDLGINEVPAAWNELSSKILGFVPKSNREGVLQDVHWSGGDFGYFPTYALGNLYAGQIYQKIREDIPLSDYLKAGNLNSIREYLDASVYQKGALYSGVETLQRVTNKSLDANLFTSYLEDKYSRLFG